MNDYVERTSAFKFKPVEDGMIGPSGHEHGSEAQAMYYGQINMCGCGTPSYVHAFIIKCMTQQREKSNIIDFEKVEQIIKDNPNDAAQFIMHSLNNANLLEHGGSVFGSWLTERGQQFVDIGPIGEDD